jgi:hypothetical protein
LAATARPAEALVVEATLDLLTMDFLLIAMTIPSKFDLSDYNDFT